MYMYMYVNNAYNTCHAACNILTRTCTCICICTCTCIYINSYTCTCACTCIYTFIHMYFYFAAGLCIYIEVPVYLVPNSAQSTIPGISSMSILIGVVILVCWSTTSLIDFLHVFGCVTSSIATSLILYHNKGVYHIIYTI